LSILKVSAGILGSENRMEFFRYHFLIFCLLGFIRFSNAGEPPRIYHIPPKILIQNKPRELTCVVESGNCNLKAVKIFLRTDPAALYKEFAMQYRDGLWSLPLIPEMLQGDSLYYFMVAEFSDFAAVAFPTEKPSEKPVKIPLMRPKPTKK